MSNNWGSDSGQSWLSWVVGAVFAFIVGVFALPAVQPILYEVFIGTPSIVQWGLISLALAVVGLKRKNGLITSLSLGLFLVFGVFVGPVADSVYAHSYMADQMQQDSTELETLPNTSTKNVRVLPRSVSDNYAQSSMQYPQFRLTDSDITYRNGSYTWSHGLVPDNFMVGLLGQQKGALYVDMTGVEKQVDVEETQFSNGRGQILFDSYRYQSLLHSPLKQHNWDTTFNAQVNESSYIAHSTTAYDWKFRLLPVPQLYAVPHHASVEVMDPNGEIESLSPEEAESSSLLQGQNFYPYSLAMFKVKSMQYIHGPLNKWFWKEDVLSIADLPEEGNNWPITVPTEGEEPGLTYFIATEPASSGNGVYEIWTVNSQTGETGVQKYSESQIGPQKAIDYVERQSEVNRLSNAEAIAPVPVVQGESLYWHAKVVPKSRTGVIYTAFVDAESGDVTLVEGTEPIYGFLTESEIDQIQNGTEEQKNGMTVRVVVTDADGNIVGTRNITAPEDGGFEVYVQEQNRGENR